MIPDLLAFEAAQAAVEDDGAGRDVDGSSTGASRTRQTAARDVDDEVVGTKEIRAKHWSTLISASKKSCFTLSPRKERLNVFDPNARIDVPFAARRIVDGVHFICEGDAGITETSAPLSTRKERRWWRQKTESAPSRVEAEESVEMTGAVPGVTDDSRLWSFPRPEPSTPAWDAGRGSSCKKKATGIYKSLGQNERDWRTLRISSQLLDVCHGLQQRPQWESGAAARRKKSHRRAGTRS